MGPTTGITPQNDDNHRGGRWWSPRAWLPWAGFRALALPWRAHVASARAMTRQEARHNALLVLAVLLVLVTVGCAVALPSLELPISVIGALFVTALVIVGSGRAREARTTLGELRLTLEESRGQQGIPHVTLVRAWLLGVLLHWQARRAEATSGGILQEGDHDHDRDGRATAAATGRGRDLGVHLYRGEDGQDRTRHSGYEPGRVRGLGDGQRLPDQPGWLARPRYHDERRLHVQAPPALTTLTAPCEREADGEVARG